MRRKAFVIMDAMLAMLLLAAMMTLLAVGLSSHQRAAQKFADTQSACNLAESSLIDLQQSKPVTKVKVERLSGGTDVQGFTWVRVTATVNGRSAALTGLARIAALSSGASTQNPNGLGG